VAIDDGRRQVDQFAVADARLIAEHLEGALLVDGVAFHEDALRALDLCAAPERAFEVLVFGEAAEHDVDRTLPVLDPVVVDVREHASFGGFPDEPSIGSVKQHDHGAGSLAHDLVDQTQRMLRIRTESDKRYVGSFPGGHRADVLHVDLSRNHLMAQRHDDRSDQSETVLALVGDQDAKVICIAVAPPLHTEIVEDSAVLLPSR
jgi:hypothetical protein